MRKLQIHFFVGLSHPQGTYFRFHNLARGLSQLGQEVTVYACDLDTKSCARTEIRDEVTYHIVPESKGSKIFASGCNPMTTWRRYRQHYPACDIAHLFQPFPSTAAAWVRSPAKLHIYDWDDLWMGGLIYTKIRSIRDFGLHKSVGYLEKHLPARAAHTTTCSRYLEALAKKRNAKSASVVINGLWPFEPQDRHTARATLGLHPDAIYVGFMGRTLKELDWCFDALAAQLKKHPQLRFALCGPPPSVLDDIAPELLPFVDYLGQLSTDEIRTFACALDIGLLPLEESEFNESRFPIKFAEYMASGTAVLCSQVGECAFLGQNMPWVVLAGKNQDDWLAAFDDALDQIASHTLPLVDKAVVDSNFSWLEISERLLNTYRDKLEE